ncbi:hypothetical protein ACPXCO_13230 [Streptomyces cyaneofuscatus]|uniref:hypothetical protein n=1 Tax=Streptomyces TaxID=1883 RepID=UPI000978DEED|nr:MULTISPECIES: hypothetical protein [unclassified Streptomyces]ONI53157.1 hypothetical protein STIB_25050 [Streptomyces sp. IB2014 011-1]
MTRRDDIVTIVIDAKNEIKKSVAGLDGRVNDLERGLRADLVHEVEGLRKAPLEEMKTSQTAAQRSASRAEARAGEAVAAVAELRRDVLRLHERLDGLHGDVGKVLEALAAIEPAAGAPRFVPGADAGAERDLALPPAREQGSGTQTEPVPGAQTMAEAPAETSVPAAAGDVSTAAEDDRAHDGEAEPASEVQAPQMVPEVDGDRDLSAVALEAAQSTDDQDREPAPLSRRGRIYAISRAARVASATLVCHRDTWEFVAAQAGSHPHFRPPALEDRENGLVAAVLSGRSLVAMLLALYQVEKTSVYQPDTGDVNEMTAYADWIMATKVYTETADVLRHAYSTDGDPVVITIDNRLPTRP